MLLLKVHFCLREEKRLLREHTVPGFRSIKRLSFGRCRGDLFLWRLQMGIPKGQILAKPKELCIRVDFCVEVSIFRVKSDSGNS